MGPCRRNKPARLPVHDLVGKIALPQCDFTAADVAAAILTPRGNIYPGNLPST